MSMNQKNAPTYDELEELLDIAHDRIDALQYGKSEELKQLYADSYIQGFQDCVKIIEKKQAELKKGSWLLIALQGHIEKLQIWKVGTIKYPPDFFTSRS